LLTDGNLRRIVISIEMHGYRGISGDASKTVAKGTLPSNNNEEAKWFVLIKRNICLDTRFS